MTPDILFLLSVLPIFVRVIQYHTQSELMECQGVEHLEAVIEFMQSCYEEQNQAALADPLLTKYIHDLKCAAHLYVNKELNL